MSKIKEAAELYALGQIAFQQLEEVCGGPVSPIVQNYVNAYIAEYNAYLAYKKAKSETNIREILLRSYEQRQEQLPLNPAALIVFKNGIKAAVFGCSKGAICQWLERHPDVELYTKCKVGDTFYTINYVDLQQYYETI